MRNFNKAYLIAAVLLVIGAAIVLFRENAQENALSDERLRQPLLGAGGAIDVDGLAITESSKSLNLSRSADGAWRIDPKDNEIAFPADAKKIATLFDALGRAKFQELASTNKANWTEFGLDNPKQLVVRAKGKDLLILNIGHNAKVGGGQYAFIGMEEKSYRISEPLSFSVEPESWELKTILDVKPEEIKSISFEPSAASKKQKIDFSREKKEDLLKVSQQALEVKGKKTLKEKSSAATEVAGLLKEVTYASHQKAEDPIAKQALAAPSILVAELFDGKIITIKTGKTKDDAAKHYLAVNISQGKNAAKLDAASEQINQLMTQYFFQVPERVASRFDKGREDFLEADTAPTVSKDATVNKKGS
jgi:hypothetical protein